MFINYEREELLAKMAAYKSLNVYERKAYTKHIGIISRQMHNDDWQQFHTFLLAIVKSLLSNRLKTARRLKMIS